MASVSGIISAINEDKTYYVWAKYASANTNIIKVKNVYIK